MVTLANFPIVSQLTQVTSDGRLSENSQFDCVPASIGAAILWYQGKTQWDTHINPDKLKDAAYGEALHNSGTDAARYVNFCASIGYQLYAVETPDRAHAVSLAHEHINRNIPVIFTEYDPYAPDPSLGWTHVCIWYGDDSAGLTALDPYIAKPIYRSDASWANLLRSNQIWIVERNDIVIAYNTPGVKEFYTETDPHHWTCIQPGISSGKIVQFAILDAYKKWGNAALCGLSYVGLPRSNEIPIEHLGPKYQQYAGKGIVVQVFELLNLLYDPNHLIDQRPGLTDAVYPAKIYDGIGADLLAAQQGTPTPAGIDPAKVKQFQIASATAAHKIVQDAQTLEAALIVPFS